jgi:hypothetical protein
VLAPFRHHGKTDLADDRREICEGIARAALPPSFDSPAISKYSAFRADALTVAVVTEQNASQRRRGEARRFVNLSLQLINQHDAMQAQYNRKVSGIVAARAIKTGIFWW